MLFLIFITTFYFLIPILQPAFASSEYELHYQSRYQVLPNETTYVEHQLQLVNKLANIYPTSYTISIGTINLKNIQVSVNQIKVKPHIDLGKNYTTISFPIPNPNIGQNQINTIKISYFNPNILEKLGKNYELNLPKLSKANEAKTYRRTLIVPATFPHDFLAIPQSNDYQETNHQLIFTWSHSPDKNITLLFGKSQTYYLQLTYQLQTNSTGTLTEIALPPDTPYQRVYLESITPQPQLIKLDPDGNWLAIYNLNQQKSSLVKANLYVQVYPQPTFTRLPTSSENLNKLLQPTRYWPTNNHQIKQLATKLKTPANIYDYLVNNFIYNYNRSHQNKRLGADKALANPQLAICTEFTDSFVALSRAIGIPAREIDGYAYTNNQQLKPLDLTQDILHAWPEYYDSQTETWKAIDPTWGNTTGGIDYFHKLDFNHIAFVRHGLEDNYPLPAGAYKTNRDTKTVIVKIVDQPPKIKESYQIKNNQIINTSNVALINKTIKLSTGQTIKIDYLPPYGHYSFTNQSPLINSLKSHWLSFSLSILVLIAIFGFFAYKTHWQSKKL